LEIFISRTWLSPLEEPRGYASFHKLAVAGASAKAQAEGDQNPDMKAGAFALCMNSLVKLALRLVAVSDLIKD
jgi:hypothetical protein